LCLTVLFLSLVAVGCGQFRREERDEIESLVERLSHGNPAERQEAARRLGVLAPDDEKATTGLIAALGDSHVGVREEAARSLQAFGQSAVAALLESLSHNNPLVRAGVLEVLSHEQKLDEKGAAAVAAALEDADGTVRIQAARALYNLGASSPTVIAKLADALEDDGELVRLTAAKVLGKLGRAAHSAVPRLRKALQDEDEGVRQAAADALRNIEQ
jgi:HEAT repeat protein